MNFADKVRELIRDAKSEREHGKHRAKAELNILLNKSADEIADLADAVDSLRHYDDPTVLLRTEKLKPSIAAIDALNRRSS